MQIGPVNTEDRVIVVAEIGNNHEGQFDVARRLVEEAACCGASAVKFQTFRAEHFVSRSDAARFARLKSFELTFNQFGQLAELAHDVGLAFISTPLDLGSAEFLDTIVDAFKIASCDNTFFPLLQYVICTGKPFVVSTGLADGDDVRNVVDFMVREAGADELRERLGLLHCVTSYPTPDDQVNLRAVSFLAESFPYVVGYSDHTLGIEACLLSVALGARIIEKHFTLDTAFSDFRDHQLSADPTQLAELVRRVRGAETLLGDVGKSRQACELPLMDAVRRSVAAGRDLSAGAILTFSDFTWVRPGGGLAPGQEAQLIGKRLSRDLRLGDRIQLADVA